MTSSNLALIILGLTIAMFLSSYLARRGGAKAKEWSIARSILAILVLCLAAYYFYLRFAG